MIEIKIGYTGRPAFAAEISGSMKHDMTLSVGGTALIIAILFWWPTGASSRCSGC